MFGTILFGYALDRIELLCQYGMKCADFHWRYEKIGFSVVVSELLLTDNFGLKINIPSVLTCHYVSTYLSLFFYGSFRPKLGRKR
jgi:hypothetical protein